MQKLEVMLLGHPYSLSCAPGEEARLQNLAAIFDNKLRQVAGPAPSASESRLFLLAGLLLADELLDLKAENAALKESSANGGLPPEHEDMFVAAVNLLTDRIGTLATKLGNA